MDERAARATHWVAVLCESPVDRAHGVTLAERALGEAIDWLEASHLEFLVCWCGVSRSDTHLEWKKLRDELDARGTRRVHGFFDGKPASPDAQNARRALLMMADATPGPSAVLLLRDLDDQPERRQGLEEARASGSWPFAVIIGAALPEREAWALAGFVPETPDEAQRLQSARQEQGFDPTSRADRLTSKRETHKHDAKRVLTHLTAGDAARARRCWETDLEVLRQNGARSGLGAYLAEIASRLVPVVGGGGAKP